LFSGHERRTAPDAGLAGLKNGALIDDAEAAGAGIFGASRQNTEGMMPGLFEQVSGNAD
jgi:hypothetical protein